MSHPAKASNTEITTGTEAAVRGISPAQLKLGVQTFAPTIKLDDMAAPDANTDLDASTGTHGLMSAVDKTKLDTLFKFAPVITESTTGRTLGLADAGTYIRLTNAAPCVITIPDQAAVAWLANTEIYFRVAAAGIPTLTHSITVNDETGIMIALEQGNNFCLKRVGSDVWDLI